MENAMEMTREIINPFMEGNEFKYEFYDLIFSHKTTKRFRPQSVNHQTLMRIVETGMHVTSLNEKQNWRYFVLQGNKLEQLSQMDGAKSWSMSFGNAPVLIFVFSTSEYLNEDNRSKIAAFMSMQNIVLSAHLEGLGTRFIHTPYKVQDSVREFFKIDQIESKEGLNFSFTGSMALGHPFHKLKKERPVRQNRVKWYR